MATATKSMSDTERELMERIHRMEEKAEMEAAEKERLKDELKAEKAKKTSSGSIVVKQSPNPDKPTVVCVYGLQKTPVSLHAGQWKRFHEAGGTQMVMNLVEKLGIPTVKAT